MVGWPLVNLLIVGLCILGIVAIGVFLAWIATGGLQATLTGRRPRGEGQRSTLVRLLLVFLALTVVVIGLYLIFRR